MNAKMKRRMIAVSGIVVIVLIIVLAIVGGNTAAKTASVAELAQGEYEGQKVQVSGNVVPESFSTEGSVLTFAIYDTDDPSTRIRVSYDGSASSTFGNDVTAICTGRMDGNGVLKCTELVTKCPSKYESGTDALTVERLLGYGDNIKGTMVKVSGTVGDGTLKPAGNGERFTLVDPETKDEVVVVYDGALSDSIGDRASVVLTGSLDTDGRFVATDVALEG